MKIDQAKLRAGFTLIEILAIIALLCCVVAGVKIGHGKIDGRFGGLIGGGLGFLSFFFVLFAFGALIDQFNGVPRLPKCRNGCCRGPGMWFGDYGDYGSQKLGEGYVNVCRCGDRYKRRDRQFVIVSENGTETPYLIWRPFRGWFPDKPPITPQPERCS